MRRAMQDSIGSQRLSKGRIGMPDNSPTSQESSSENESGMEVTFEDCDAEHHRRGVFGATKVRVVRDKQVGGSSTYSTGTSQLGVDEQGPQPDFPRSAFVAASASVPYIGAVVLVSLAFCFPGWKGTWIFATVLVAWAIIRYFNAAMWYRRMAASSLALAATSAAIPSIVANWSSGKARWDFAIDTSPWVAIAFVVAAVSFACIELKVRRGA